MRMAASCGHFKSCGQPAQMNAATLAILSAASGNEQAGGSAPSASVTTAGDGCSCALQIALADNSSAASNRAARCEARAVNDWTA